MKPEEVADRLDVMKADMALPSPKPIYKIDKILDDLLKTRLEDSDVLTLSDYAVTLSVYSLFLQQEVNRYNTFVNWCESNIKHIVGKRLHDVEGFTFNEKDIYIRATDTHAQELETRKLSAKAKIDTLYGLSDKLKFVCDTIRNACYAKSRIGN